MGEGLDFISCILISESWRLRTMLCKINPFAISSTPWIWDGQNSGGHKTYWGVITIQPSSKLSGAKQFNIASVTNVLSNNHRSVYWQNERHNSFQFCKIIYTTMENRNDNKLFPIRKSCIMPFAKLFMQRWKIEMTTSYFLLESLA